MEDLRHDVRRGVWRDERGETDETQPQPEEHGFSFPVPLPLPLPLQLRAQARATRAPGVMARARGIVAAVRASAWGMVIVRAGFLGGALLVFAWIGLSFGMPPSAARADPSAADAGGTPRLVPSASSAASPVTFAAPPPTGTARPARATPEDPVYVNHASTEELRRLPGVGAKRAEAIVALRQRVGRFQRVEDLLRVKGIGRATLRRWRPLVRLEAPRPPQIPSQSPPASDAGS
jgi:competence protein ComEA